MPRELVPIFKIHRKRCVDRSASDGHIIVFHVHQAHSFFKCFSVMPFQLHVVHLCMKCVARWLKRANPQEQILIVSVDMSAQLSHGAQFCTVGRHH